MFANLETYLLGILLTGMLVSSTTHGYTGIQRAGSRVYTVHKGSPADKAGIKVGDKVLLIDHGNSTQIDGPAGIDCELDIQRGAEKLHFTVPRVPHNEAYE